MVISAEEYLQFRTEPLSTVFCVGWSVKPSKRVAKCRITTLNHTYHCISSTHLNTFWLWEAWSVWSPLWISGFKRDILSDLGFCCLTIPLNVRSSYCLGLPCLRDASTLSLLQRPWMKILSHPQQQESFMSSSPTGALFFLCGEEGWNTTYSWLMQPQTKWHHSEDQVFSLKGDTVHYCSPTDTIYIKYGSVYLLFNICIFSSSAV